MKSIRRFLLAAIFFSSFGVIYISAWTVANQPYELLFYMDGAAKLKGDDFDNFLKTAFELYQQKKYDEALASCIKAAGLKPKDFRPPALAGFIYMAQWKLKNASEEFAKSISLKPDYKQTYIYKAKADNLRGEKEEALAACREALKIDSSFAEAYTMIGDTLRFDEKRRDEAIAAYRSAIKLNSNSPNAYENLGAILVAAKDEKGAEEAFRKAMAADSRQMVGRFSLGRLLVKRGRLKEARLVWEERTSDKDNTFPNFIVLLERAEKLQQAADALAQNPDDSETLVQMGNAVMEGDSWVVDGRQEKAIVYFRRALELKPDFAEAQYAICKAYIQIADTYKDKNKNVDEELAKLRKFDPKLVKEIEDYRKNYSGGIKTSPINLNQ